MSIFLIVPIFKHTSYYDWASIFIFCNFSMDSVVFFPQILPQNTIKGTQKTNKQTKVFT